MNLISADPSVSSPGLQSRVDCPAVHPQSKVLSPASQGHLVRSLLELPGHTTYQPGIAEQIHPLHFDEVTERLRSKPLACTVTRVGELDAEDRIDDEAAAGL